MTRSLLEPRLVDPSAAEPGLVVDVRDERRCLLFDLGVLSALPPRVLVRVSHFFVTHTHMDHFAGFDLLLAMTLGRHAGFTLWGGPGFVDQVEHKLRAYTWNVVHRYEQPLVLQVHALSPDGSRCHASFDSRDAFARRDLASPASPRAASQGGAAGADPDDVLHDELTFRVRARFVDHEMPVLAFALEEKARLRVRAERLAEGGLTSGPWLAALKQAVLRGDPPGTRIALRWRDRHGHHEGERSVAELAPLVLDPVPGRCIGYVTDLRGSDENLQVLQALLDGVDRLYIECVFSHADRAHAQRKNHLTARRAGEIARALHARELVPFHFSPRYQGREHELVAEALEAWQGAGPGFRPPG